MRLREPVSLPTLQRFDWPGSLTFTFGLGSLLLAASLVAFPLINQAYVNALFAYACAANAINGLARGAVLFVLIFFLQGPYGLDPLWAGIMMAPFGAAFMSTGQMLSIAIVFPLVLSRIPEEVMFHVFLYGGGMNGAPLAAFETGMYQAFLASFAITLLAAVISGLRPRHKHFGLKL